MFFPGGSGSNEILTLTECAERLGLDGRSRADRAVVRRLRKLEQNTGRRILVQSGSGKGVRYMILRAELDAALDGEARTNVDSMAERIAAAVGRIESRVERLAGDVVALGRRVDRLEKR